MTLNQYAFSTLSQLKNTLRHNGIDVSKWGTGATKSVENLWHELKKGDTKLYGKPVYRVVEVAVVIIKRGNKILIEREQIFGDGRSRPRNWPPSEKMHPNESPQSAALRCVEEELCLPATKATVVNDQIIVSSDVRESPSYPGLKTEYRLYTVGVSVEDLPPTDFRTYENTFEVDDPVIDHVWEWGEIPPDLYQQIHQLYQSNE